MYKLCDVLFKLFFNNIICETKLVPLLQKKYIVPRGLNSKYIGKWCVINLGASITMLVEKNETMREL